MSQWQDIEGLCDEAIARHPGQDHMNKDYYFRRATYGSQSSHPFQMHQSGSSDSITDVARHSPTFSTEVNMVAGNGIAVPTLDQMFSTASDHSSMHFGDAAGGASALDYLNMDGDVDFPPLM
jgi:hypothetical protein